MAALVCTSWAVQAQSGPIGLMADLPGRIYPRTNWWNVDISGAPVDTHSAAWIEWISGRDADPAAVRPLHPDFGPSPYGIPYLVVAANQSKVAVTFVEFPDESDAGAAGQPAGYPIPDAAKTVSGYIEGATAGGGTSGDRHMLIVDRDRWLLYELYHARWNSTLARWQAGSGAVFDLATNSRRPEGWTSADAAGLAILPGLVRYDEAYGAAEIQHALRVTIRDTSPYVWPASHTAGGNATAPPMGARLRLKSTKNISTYPPPIRRIFRAMQVYGLIVADNGSDMYITGTMDARWDNDVLNPAFASLTADDFEVIAAAWNPPAPPEPVRGDFSGTSDADFAVYRPTGGMWYVRGGATTAWGLPNDVPVPADYDGDGHLDVAVFRPATAQWLRPGQPAVGFGQIGDVPVPADYDGDRRADLAVFRRATATWFVYGQTPIVAGLPGDLPVPADYDGDGRVEVAVFRPSTGEWRIGALVIPWGAPGDLPVPADYTGDGRADIAVFRPSSGTWFVRNVTTMPWGQSGDLPVPMDVDSDGRADCVVFRRSTGQWFAKSWQTGAVRSAGFGQAGDWPALAPRSWRGSISGDADGDGRADIAVFRPSSGVWYWLFSGANWLAARVLHWGTAGDVPVAVDLDADGRGDAVVYRPSIATYYASRSSTDYQSGTGTPIGVAGATVVSGDFDGDGFGDAVAYHAPTGGWTIRRSSTGTLFVLTLGSDGERPVPADFDGDRITDVAVVDPATGLWRARLSTRGWALFPLGTWGQTGDVPVVGDYDGDGLADLAMFRPSTGTWLIQPRAPGAAARVVPWGISSDVPVPLDIDGDGRTDVAVFRPSSGTWYVAGQVTMQWGTRGDVPIH